MELKEGTFKNLEDFNDYVNIELIENGMRVDAITVLPIGGEKLKIFYYLVELED